MTEYSAVGSIISGSTAVATTNPFVSTSPWLRQRSLSLNVECVSKLMDHNLDPCLSPPPHHCLSSC